MAERVGCTGRWKMEENRSANESAVRRSKGTDKFVRAYITRLSEPRHREISHFGTRPPRLLDGVEATHELATSFREGYQTKRDRSGLGLSLTIFRIINVGFRETLVGSLPGPSLGP